LKGEPIDLLMNNAGVYEDRQVPLDEFDEESWIEALRANTIAPMKIATTFLLNVAAGRRRIVAAISSRLGNIGDNTSGGYYA
jgi:short-subunit dehydrogenase